MVVTLPDGSIYFWMFSQGLKHTDLGDIREACMRAGVPIRKKDEENFWNGWYESDMYRPGGLFSLRQTPPKKPYFDMRYSDYQEHLYLGQPEIQNRWVPCNASGKPLYKWSSGCMTKVDAMSLLSCKSLAENMKGTKMIVIDCDGDHGEGRLDTETIMFLSKYMDVTHTLSKPKSICEYDEMKLPEGWLMNHVSYMEHPASFHLTFAVDRMIPTMHFGKSHIDIVGNEKNSLRYLKNKTWNNMQPLPMTDEIWEDIKQFVYRRENS